MKQSIVKNIQPKTHREQKISVKIENAVREELQRQWNIMKRYKLYTTQLLAGRQKKMSEEIFQ